ncbi:MAG TPA: beta-propeller domain-containing protein, partial [Clostridia bacterium]
MKLKWKAVTIIAAAALSICALQFSTATGENSSVKAQKVITLYVGSPTAIVNNEETRIDADNPDVVPLIENERTLVPVRFISEKLGLKVEWNNEASSVDIKNGETEISLVLGSNEMKVGERRIKLDTEAKSVNGRTFIPLRAMVEAIGKKVFYDRGLIVISDVENIYDANKDKEKLDGLIASINRPPVVGSEDAFKALIKSSQIENGILWRGNFDVKEDAAFTSGMPAPEMKNEAAKQKSAAHNDYSKTNVQVQGVDESDVVKTDGEYIYQVNNGRIVIAKVYPAQDLEVASIVNFEGKDFSPSEIYVDEKHLTVIGNTTGEVNFNSSITSGDEQKCPPPVNFGATRAVVYDISDKKNVKELRQFEIEGSCVSSRKIGSTLYLVTVKNVPYQVRYMLDDSGLKKQYEEEYKDYGEGVVRKVIDAAVRVSYRDSGSGDGFQQIGYDRMYYFPDAVYQNYMNV